VVDHVIGTQRAITVMETLAELIVGRRRLNQEVRNILKLRMKQRKKGR
jgi:hypothetical protein